VVVFSRGEAGYFCIKIPVLISTFNGTLIAIGEARNGSCSDFTSTDLVYKRSVDNGATWSTLMVLFGNSSAESTVIGNAAPVQDSVTGRILIPFCRNNLQVFLTFSDDDGVSWSYPQMIQGILPDALTWVGTGPPGSIQLLSGRILVPAYRSETKDDDGEFAYGFVFVSDDHGESWSRGGVIKGPQFPNECQAVEVSPNQVYVNSRGLFLSRTQAWSSDGGQSFSSPSVIRDLEQTFTGCEGSTIRHPRSGVLFYSGPFDHKVQRYNMSLFTSVDNAQSWNQYSIVYPGSSAYSSLAVLEDNSVGLLYEIQNKTEIIFTPDLLFFEVVVDAEEVKYLERARTRTKTIP